MNLTFIVVTNVIVSIVAIVLAIVVYKKEDCYPLELVIPYSLLPIINFAVLIVDIGFIINLWLDRKW